MPLGEKIQRGVTALRNRYFTTIGSSDVKMVPD